MNEHKTPFPARLTSDASPYAFVEVSPMPQGAWAKREGGRSGQAYEANGRPGLGGNIVEIFWSSAGDWRFYGPAPRL
jgi:hypothetical protein